MRISIKRVYDPPETGDGARVLVDRLWPRGLSRERARVDLWLKDVAPSNDLRKRFGHDPAKWPEFRRRYLAELENNPALAELAKLIAHDPVTLLFAAKDVEHNNAVVLKQVLETTGGKRR